MMLADRVAIVSGIGPGMGRDISLTFAREGADLVLAARTESKLKDVAAEVEARGRQALCVPTDITELAQCQRLATAAQERFGRIDILVNNAFVQPPFERIEDTTVDTWRSAFDINVIGGVQMSNAVAPYMKERGGGAIVFINSMSARRVREFFGVYSAAKNALIAVARTLAKEWGGDGIRVNSVAPGYIWGPSVEWYFKQVAEQRGCTPQEIYDEVASETCLKHLPTSAEISESVLFLASDMARVITGQTLDVNAGHWFH